MIEAVIITTVVLCITIMSGSYLGRVYLQCTQHIQSFKESSLEELEKFRVTQEISLAGQKEEAQKDLQQMLEESNAELDLRRKEIDLAEEESINNTNLQIQAKLDTVKDEYHQMEQHFRQSVDDDVTLKLVMAAYAVVARGESPRGLEDSTLTNAVIAHKRSAGDYGLGDDGELN